MYQTVVIDDERHIADGLAKLVAHVDTRFEVIRCFYESRTAEQWLNEHLDRIDLIITDICMPGKSGLELIEHFSEAAKRPRFIILSGFGEFEYARKAISYGVVAYLLKPVDTVELKKALNEIAGGLSDASGSDAAEAVPDAETGLIRTLRRYILTHYRDFSVKKMSDDLSMNGEYLSRAFKRATGASINVYLMEVRMKKAAELLRENCYMKVYEVCELVGYHDQIYFSKQFQKYYGVRPKQYQQHGMQSEIEKVDS